MDDAAIVAALVVIRAALLSTAYQAVSARRVLLVSPHRCCSGTCI
jgi:hypothetical protein